jgi:PAS domain S-box-containing protein
MKPGRSAIANVFLVATALLVASILFTYLVGLAAIESNRKVSAARAVLQRLDQLISTVRDAETAQRGYLLTGDAQSLAPYRRAIVQVEVEEAGLRGLASSGELPAPPVEALLRLTQEKRTELEQSVQIRRDSALEPALALVRAVEGKATLERIRALVAQMAAVQQSSLDQAVRRAEVADALRTSVFLLTVAFNLGFLAWAYRRITREVHLREAAALETSRQTQLMATTLASIGDGVIACDAQGRLTFLNQEAERLTGWTNAEAVCQCLPAVFRLVDEQTRAAVDNPLQKVLSCGSKIDMPSGTLLLRKDGNAVPIGDSAAPIRQPDGLLVGVVVVFRDISEHVKNEEVRAHLAAIVQSSGDAIISNDVEGAILSWNLGAERMFGYTPGEVIGKSFSLLVPTDQMDQEKQILRRIHGGVPAEQFETSRLTKTGRVIPVSVTVSPLKDQAGRIIGTSRIIRDITELVAARETLARGKAQLERLVEARTTKLREMVTELQHISYAITHDMRAPLRAMGAFAQMLLEESVSARGSAQSKEYCRRILTAAGRLDTLIRDALSFTRAVLQELPLLPVNLSSLLRGIIDTYPNLHSDFADIEIEGNLPVVMGNESLLTQCFANLLGNAVKFVAPGVRPCVRIRAESNGALVRISVQDNGIGIPTHAQPRLFGMFQKLDNQYEGTGIGLAIVRKVAERMGGKVGVESEAGNGSRFWVELKPAQPHGLAPNDEGERISARVVR